MDGRGETFEDAVFEGGDDGVVDVALAADRRRLRGLWTLKGESLSGNFQERTEPPTVKP
jgi:hypothetical protein